MEYPGSTFKRPYRLAMLFIFITAFFLISPTVILYSAGYRYDFKNGLLREVGSLSVDVLPQNTEVYLNGLKLKEKMPIRLNNITPHKYTLRLSSPGYYDWEKQIEVKKNQTTYVKEIILLKKGKPELITKDNIENIVLSNTGRYLVFESPATNNGIELRIRNQESERLATVANLKPGEYEYEWAPLSDYLLVRSKTYPYETMFIISATQPDQIVEVPRKPGDIEKTVWRKSAEPELYYSTKDGIGSFLPRLDQNRSITQNYFFDWYMDGGTLWTIQPNTSTNSLEIYEDSLGFNTYFSSVNFNNQAQSDMLSWRLILVAKNNVLLQNPSSGQFFIIKRDKNYLVSGNNYFISKFNNWLLIWTPWELWTYSDGEEPFLLNRSGNEMKDVKPLDQFNTLALEWDNDVTALYPYYFVDRMIQDKPIRSMAVDTENRSVYFSNNSGLWKLNY